MSQADLNIDLLAIDERAQWAAAVHADLALRASDLASIVDPHIAIANSLADLRVLIREVRLSRAALSSVVDQLRHRDNTIAQLREIIHAGTASGAHR